MLPSLLTVDSPGAAPMSALLADRDDDTRQMYGAFLRALSVDLDEASDGREALAKALSRPHDVVVTETRLPGINGYELCQLLRRDMATKATPIIVVTAEAFASNLERARRAGADKVLVKPCLPDQLLMEMRRLVGRSKELRHQSQQIRARLATQLSASQALHSPRDAKGRRALSRLFSREVTTTPPDPPPTLVCPICDQPLQYRTSHVGGVSERHREQWDYFECANGCGDFQYRQRTRKLRKVS
jgi:two-component system cell cycle response regulator DivK